MPVLVRTRTDDDLDRGVALAQSVHEVDGYPPFLPTDLRTFLATPGAIESWVAVRDAEIVGHVALHPSTHPAAMNLAADASGHPPDQLGVVARMLVAPTARNAGIGERLLRAAVDRARELDRYPILDVATQFEPAIRLYERCGWTRAGTLTVTFDGVSLDEHVYLGPDG
jgi:GNAT superfamily N-acetyltransferase